METAVNLTNDRFYDRQISTALLPPKSLQKITKSTDGKELRVSLALFPGKHHLPKKINQANLEKSTFL